MSLEEFKARYRSALEEAYYRGNLEALDELYAPDVVIHRPPQPDVKGLTEYKQHVLAARQAYTDIQFDWEEMIGEGNTVALRSTWRMKHTGESPALPVPPTGKEVVMRGGLFIHLKDGKGVEVFEYKDYLGLLQQFGVTPPPRA
ncbi:MAG: ester cyclase [Chloroflexota bacterium]|nr:ester cyclase [Chloroflexota bacterium]